VLPADLNSCQPLVQKNVILKNGYLLRVRASVDVDEQGILVPFIEVVRKVKPDFGIVLSSVDLDVQVGDLGEILFGLLGENKQRKLKFCSKWREKDCAIF